MKGFLVLCNSILHSFVFHITSLWGELPEPDPTFDIFSPPPPTYDDPVVFESIHALVFFRRCLGFSILNVFPFWWG